MGNWCLVIDRMFDAFVYRRCDLAKADMMINKDGFESRETSCHLETITKLERGWVAAFKCSGAGVEWREDDKIIFERGLLKIHVKIRESKRVSDPMIRYCLTSRGC